MLHRLVIRTIRLHKNAMFIWETKSKVCQETRLIIKKLERNRIAIIIQERSWVTVGTNLTVIIEISQINAH